jgi:glycosyltransferase involved in cell wall biosynthesis
VTVSPAVSIILPTYDRLEYLKEAVESVLAQTVADWELIVVDDGSADASVPWLEAIGDRRIAVVRQAHTGNRSRLRNIALSCARADWIAFIDSDDRWKPAKLERQLAYHAANPAIRWSYTARTMIDSNGQPLSAALFNRWEPYSGRILEQVLALEANIALPSVMAERTLLREAGGFDEAWLAAQDFELWLRLAERCDCGVVDEPLVEIRKHRSVTYQQPDVSLGFTAMYQSFAERTRDPALRAQSRTRAAYHAVNAADRLAMLHQWSDATAALLVALRIRPLAPFAYRAFVRLVARRFLAAIGSSSAHAA